MGSSSSKSKKQVQYRHIEKQVTNNLQSSNKRNDNNRVKKYTYEEAAIRFKESLLANINYESYGILAILTMYPELINHRYMNNKNQPVLTPLMLVAFYNQPSDETETTLIHLVDKAGIKCFSEKESNGFNAFQIAAMSNQSGNVELLINLYEIKLKENNPQMSKQQIKNQVTQHVNTRCGDNLTAMHLAAIGSNGKYSDHGESFKILLRNGGDPSLVDNFGKTPLEYLENHNSKVEYQRIIQQSSNRRNDNNQKYTYKEAVSYFKKLLLANQKDGIEAALEMYPELINHRYKDTDGKPFVTPLMIVAGLNQPSNETDTTLSILVDKAGMKCLLEKDGEGCNAFQIAAMFNKSGNVQSLINLYEIKLEENNPQMSKQQIKNQVTQHVNTRCENNITAMHLAAIGSKVEKNNDDHGESFKILLRNGGDPSLVDNFGKTPLEYLENHNSKVEYQRIIQQYAAEKNDNNQKYTYEEAAIYFKEFLLRNQVNDIEATLSIYPELINHRYMNNRNQPVLTPLMLVVCYNQPSDETDTTLYTLVDKVGIKCLSERDEVDRDALNALQMATIYNNGSIQTLISLYESKLEENNPQMSKQQIKNQVTQHVNARCGANLTAMHLAAIGSNEDNIFRSESFKILLRNGGDPSLVDNFGKTPLEYLENHTNKVEYQRIIQQSSNRRNDNNQKYTYEEAAIYFREFLLINQKDGIEAALTMYPELINHRYEDSDDQPVLTPLMLVAFYNQPSDETDTTLIHLVDKAGIKCLLEKESNGFNAFQIAAILNKSGNVELLINLYEIKLKENNPQMSKQQIKNQVAQHVNTRCGANLTAMHLAAKGSKGKNNDHGESFKILLRNGGDPSLVDNSGRTPLECLENHTSKVEYQRIIQQIGHENKSFNTR